MEKIEQANQHSYRSSHHIWNEAQQAVVFEIYASQYAHAGMKDQAGAFKRAALSASLRMMMRLRLLVKTHRMCSPASRSIEAVRVVRFVVVTAPAEPTADGWETVEGDLSPHAGKEVLLVVECANGGRTSWWAEDLHLDEITVRQR